MMENSPQSENDLAAEFRKLGENLAEVLKTAWQSEERQKIQREIESGLAQLDTVLRETAGEITQEPVAQRLRAEAEDLRERVRRGEVQSNVRAELLDALGKVNAELNRIVSQWSGGDSTDPPSGSADPAPPAPDMEA